MTTESMPEPQQPAPLKTAPKKSRLEIAWQKRDQVDALIQRLEAQARTKQAEQERKLETRRKVLLGAYLLAKMQKDEEMKAKVLADLDKYLGRDAERALFDLAPLPKPESGPAAKERKALQAQAAAPAASTWENPPHAQDGAGV